MNRTVNFSQTLRFLIGAASLGISLLILNFFAGFVNMLIMAVILVIVFSPFMYWLIHKKVPVAISLIITMAVVIAIVIALFTFLIFSLSQLSAAIPEYAAELDGFIKSTQRFFTSYGLDITDTQAVISLIEPTRLIDFVKEFLASLMGVLSDIVFIFLILAFLLIGVSGFAEKAERIIAQGNPTLARWSQYSRDIRHYIVITNNVGMMAGAINGIMLAFIGVDFAILWGVLSWLLSYIPMVGFFLALIPPVILAFLEFGWGTAVFVLVAYILINSMIDDVLKPKLMGDGLDLTPVMVLISVLFWSLVLGPLGSILAVPVTLGVKQLILEPDPDNRWLAELISSDKPRTNEPAPNFLRESKDE
jgi:predicted PurR-regulated permease PerM